MKALKRLITLALSQLRCNSGRIESLRRGGAAGLPARRQRDATQEELKGKCSRGIYGGLYYDATQEELKGSQVDRVPRAGVRRMQLRKN